MNESMDHVLADWLREGPESGPREGLDRALAATRRVGQRPGWTLTERWLPMQLTMTRTPSLRPLLAIAIPALLLVALVAAALFIGANRPRIPPPFGPARNGAIVYEQGGDLYIADGVGETARELSAGPESDAFPVFSNQGDRLAFTRAMDDEFQVMTILPDGSNQEILASLPGSLDRMAWSPDGSALLVGFTESGPSGLRLALVRTDGSDPSMLSPGYAVDYGSWRPGGTHIVYRGQLADGRAGLFIADGDGMNARQVPIDAVDLVDFEGVAWSPDGQHLSFMSAGVDGVDGWQINIADIDSAGTVSQLHRMKLDPASTDEYLPVWSPDSSRLAFLLEKDSRRQVAIVNADGTGYHVVGPETFTAYILSYTWSPDGRTLLITEFLEDEAQRESSRRMWAVDVATRRQTEVQTPVGTWQRLAP